MVFGKTNVKFMYSTIKLYKNHFTIKLYSKHFPNNKLRLLISITIYYKDERGNRGYY